MSEEKKVTKEKKIRQRSPGYPLIDLKDAIQRAKILWDKDKTSLMPRDVVFEHLGFKFKGGYGARVIASLKHFNLILEKQSDILLTQTAIDLAVLQSTDKQYIETVKKIALKPAIYSKVYSEYNGQLPSDANLKLKLISKYGFNPTRVDDFIAIFRKTISFAGLTGGLGIDVHEDVKVSDEQGFVLKGVEDNMKAKVPLAEISSHIQKSYPIPLSKGKNAAIVFESLPVEKKDIEALRKWLEFYSDNLTETKE